MSNTDGEDTQKVSLGELLLNAGTRIVDLEKQSNDQVEIITHLEKQLASLREQLATEQDMRSTAEFANRMIIKDLNEKLKQKEDENRELVEVIVNFRKAFDKSNEKYADWTATLELYEAMKPVNEVISRLSAKLSK